jgi:colanic acid/amylovoran biosynthesis glycosyltransferase
MRIAYFINTYPAVSHTFIRREIRALEALGETVLRFALRAGPNLVDVEDRAEATQTRHILQARWRELIQCCFAVVFARPFAVVSVIHHALRMGWRSDRGMLRHLAYVAEAAVLAQWCQRDGVQHLHAHFGTNSTAIAMFASRFSGIPYSFTVHGPEEFKKSHLLSLDAKLQRAAFAACVSAFGRNELMRLSPPDQWAKIAVVHCGVDHALLTAAACEIPPTPRFVCVGRLCEEKAQLIIVAAAQRLREAGLRCEIVLAGDGPMRNSIEEAITKAGLQETVIVRGWLPGEHVRAEIEASRALILPSFSENLPVAIMEAMALNRPVISTFVAGIPELVENGKTGWLVQPGDDIALAEAMREAIVASQKQLAAMGAAGRGRILGEHDALKEAQKLKNLFERGEATAG